MRIWLTLCLVLGLPQAQALTSITLSADSITHDGAHLEKANVHLDLTGKAQSTIDAKTLTYGEARLDDAHINLDLNSNLTLLITASNISADQFIARKPTIFLDYRKNIPQPSLRINAEVKAKADPDWGTFQLNCLIPAKVSKTQSQAQSQAPWQCVDGLFKDARSNIPFSINIYSQLAQASTNKKNVLKVGEAIPKAFKVDLQVNNAKFSDASGLHAGEKLTGLISIAAQQYQQGWNWQGTFNWAQGELFWQPFYFAEGGKRFDIQGHYRAPQLSIHNATLEMPGVGTLTSSSELNLETKAFQRLKVEGKSVDFAGLYQSFIQPLVAKSAFGNLKVSGKADWSFEAEGTQPQKFVLDIENANLTDLNGKFGFSNFNAHIPWDYDTPQQIFMGYTGGQVLNMPLGPTYWRAYVNRYSITAPELSLPILDGALQFEDVSAAWINQSMVWHLKMDLKPISMNSFSKALGWPEMRGHIDGHIPLVTYAGKQLNMDGDMQFNMFKGRIGMSGLHIDDPLGAVPKLNANFIMRDIDLGEITRTFNFGSIEGKLEGDVQDLRLQNWKPIYMNAVIQTADGKHEKKISQRAVENITALGGEGTAAALQRTFLRFFKEFGYEKIGLSCQLRGDICKMGGVEPTPTGFVIVKGKGAPSVNVNGYTQYVSWKDILARMQRITDSNTKIVVD